MITSLPARLSEIREVDGAQKYEITDDGIPSSMRIVWLVGIDRAQNVSVGDTGRLLFGSPIRGQYSFRKDQA